MGTRRNAAATWIKYLAWVAIVVIVTGALSYLAVKNIGYTVAMNKDGTATITVHPNDSFPDILKKAMAKDPKLVNATLASEHYYKLTDLSLVSALEHLNYSEVENQKIASGLRDMLYDLRGPFAVPGALRSAKNGAFVGALNDLDDALKNATSANAILAKLWENDQNRTGIFKLRRFSATVEIVPNAPFGDETYPNVFTCPGSALPEGRIIQITGVGQYKGQTLAEVHQNMMLFPCDRPGLTVEELLAQKKVVRLGLSERVFRRLTSIDATERKINVSFFLYAKDQAPRISINAGM